MGKKKNQSSAASTSSSVSKRSSKVAESYALLTELNDQLLASSALAPSPKDVQSSCEAIWELVTKIRSLQDELSQYKNTQTDQKEQRTANFGRFSTWCAENGVQSDKVELKMYEGVGVGLQATQRIQHHEMFLCIPRSMMMTVDWELSSLGKLLRSDPIASRMPNIALALYLLSEKFSKNSKWKPFIDVLPADYDTGLYFNPEEILLMKGSTAYEQAVSMQRNIARQYAYFWALFVNQADKYPVMAKNFTYNSYRWAVSTVMTRQNIIPSVKNGVVEQGGVLSLIPYWDMCNHEFGEMLTDYDEDLNECHCYATAVYDPGDQVFICYGNRSNSDFLVHNGFVCENNPHDTVQIKLGLSKTDSYIKTRRSILQQYGVANDDVQVFHLGKSDNEVPANLLSFLRVFNATENELQSLVEADKISEKTGPLESISAENDQKCYKYLKDRCTLLLRTYTGKFEDVESMDGSHVAMAQRLVQSEMNILHHMIKNVSSKLEN